MPTYSVAVFREMFTVEANSQKEAELFALNSYRDRHNIKSATLNIKKGRKVRSYMTDINPVAVREARLRRYGR